MIFTNGATNLSDAYRTFIWPIITESRQPHSFFGKSCFKIYSLFLIKQGDDVIILQYINLQIGVI